MAVEVIEANLTPAQPSSTKRGYARYKELRLIGADGRERTLTKVAVGPGMPDHIARGGQGRYYVADVDGARAVFGVRRADGSAHYSHWTNIEPFVLVGAVIGLVCAVARFVVGVGAPLLPAILGPLLLLAWFYMRNQRLSAKRAFDETP